MSGIHLALLGMSFGGAPVPEIGAAYEGGFFAGQISTAGNGVADFNIVVSPRSSGDNGYIRWKTTATDTTGTNSVIDGPTNSANMNNASHPAAQFCEGLTIGGYSDWYMPAQKEAELFYYNLKPLTTSNNTSYEWNIYAVPSRAFNYTASVPAQTSASDFQSGGAEAFTSSGDAALYWTSTQRDATNAWVKYMAFGGVSSSFGKNNSFSVRAVRRVAV